MPNPGRPPIEFEITKSAFGGDGISSFSGKTCFVEGALPGEKVLAAVFDEKKNYLRARVLNVLKSSPARVEAPCPYYSHCGGCQYQHASYPEELKLKELQVREILERTAGLRDIFKDIVHSEKDYGYRNGVTLHVISPRNRKDNRSLGFVSRDNVSKIPVKNCLLADEKLSPVFGMKLSPKKDPEKITFKLSEKGEIVSDLEERFLRIRIGQQSILTHSQGFFQNNLAVTGLLMEKVGKWVSSFEPQIFFDLYAGVGTFSLLCARETKKIICVEESPASVKAMRMNREEGKLSQMDVVEGKVEKVFPEIWASTGKENSVVLLDPPRQGANERLTKFLSEQSNIGAIIYVSCDPATLARDLKIILNHGHFKAAEVVPFDMFPRTGHIEIAALLIRKQTPNDPK